jgi:catechol 2,3-dioxygenase-like lactoylglutathione lyase family enzyme
MRGARWFGTLRSSTPRLRGFPGAARLSIALAFVLACAVAYPAAGPARAATKTTASASTVSGPPLVTGVGPVGMTVADMDRSLDFYTHVLDFEKVSDVEIAGEAFERLEGVFGARARVVNLQLGDERLELTQYLAPEGLPFPAGSHGNDHWFQHVAIIVSDMDRAYARLREAKAQQASTGPQRIPDWNKGAAGIRAFYFRDPDGHFLEILSFPPDKGAAKWHATDRLFLGIDHTAIVVTDTDASLRFYRDRLGFRVAGEGENFGPEQEHLNNVFGARLRITSVRAASGPAIEFLEYLAPRDGRPYPAGARANDLVHWQTRLVARSLASVWAALRAGHDTFISPGPVSLPDSALGFRSGLVVRDPDGHAMEVVER